MRATGIVRRIDDLGRVVIPKEIRRQMRIKEGDPLEIFTENDGTVCFKKYSAYNEKQWDNIKRIVIAALPATDFALYDRYGDKSAEHTILPSEWFDDYCDDKDRAIWVEGEAVAYCNCDEYFDTISRIVKECLREE